MNLAITDFSSLELTVSVIIQKPDGVPIHGLGVVPWSGGEVINTWVFQYSLGASSVAIL